MHDLNIFVGPVGAKPKWNRLNIEYLESRPFVNKITVPWHELFVINNFMARLDCDRIIEDFDRQNTYPVGVSGYSNTLTDVGSRRAMGWMSEFADHISNRLYELNVLPQLIHKNNFHSPHPEYTEKGLKYLGSTPWMRFMKYIGGGKHVPHHDAAFVNESEQYITLYSWVLYLNDVPSPNGGAFQFVNDNQLHLPPVEWQTKDWDSMAPTDRILHSFQPQSGQLLVFPHWLCHQVEKLIEGERYIIRGDIAYTWE